MYIANLISAARNVEGSVRLLNYISLLHQLRQDVGSILVVGGHLLGLGELLFELLDLILSLVVEGLGKTLSLHLLLHVSMSSTALRTSFEEVSTASI